MAVLNNRMKTGQKKIQGVFNKFESMVSDLNDGIISLADHKQRNNEAIREKTDENAVIDADMERTGALVQGLQALTNG
jgi:hypothetical protein